jgi:protein ImuB
MQKGDSRHYYRVEDEHGRRYRVFRQRTYDSGDVQWLLHGYFA